MASTAAPYGLRPVKRVDGMPYAGANEVLLIDPAGEATNIFYGQVVIIGADGYIAISTATGADIAANNLGGNGVGAIGVFVGCEYINAQGQLIHSQYYPSGTLNAKAYVVTDPNVVFQAQCDGAVAQADLGTNTFFAAVQSTSTGSTRTGNSTTALDATVQAGAAAFRIVGFASIPGDAFTDVLVKFNPTAHSYTNNVGL
jgi:hypothetical protein